jgi:hypothetical protein
MVLLNLMPADVAPVSQGRQQCPNWHFGRLKKQTKACKPVAYGAADVRQPKLRLQPTQTLARVTLIGMALEAVQRLFQVSPI